jgi:23S rRNA (guanosine2251-2'-O)-methyltransferase
VPGNSARRGAIRKTSKKPTAGSGGRVKRGLEGKGPTPRAEDRPYHKAHKAKQAKQAKDTTAKRSGGPQRRTSDAEWIAGRNPVVEALRARVPITSTTCCGTAPGCA